MYFAILKLNQAPPPVPMNRDVFVNNSTSFVVISHAIRNKQTSYIVHKV